MKRIIKVWLIIFTSLHAFIHAAEIKEAASKMPAENTRTLLIFLDDSEQNIGPISSALLTALQQKSAPILASSHLFLNIFVQKPSLVELAAKDPEDNKLKQYIDIVMKYLTEHIPYRKELTAQQKADIVQGLNKTVGKAPFVPSRSGNPELYAAVVKEMLYFESSEWIIKSIPSLTDCDYVLLVPRDYLPSLMEKATSIKMPSPTDPLTDDELLLGLKIDHFETMLAGPFSKGNLLESKDPIARFMAVINSLFVTRAEYAQWKKPAPNWVIFLNGHGGFNRTIATLSFNQFEQLLNFLNSKINTKLFVYESCYAAGKNAQEIYKESMRGVGATYPFPIVTLALTDDVTYSTIPGALPEERFQESDIDFVNRHTKLEIIKNFAEFVRVAEQDNIDYKALVNSIKDKKKGSGYFNLAQIRMPGLGWFTALDFDKETAVIGKAMARSRTAPLPIKQFFKRDPRALLLEARNIPFEIVADGTKLKFIISMIPGNAIHKIKKISSPVAWLPSLMKYFIFERGIRGAQSETSNPSRKIFWIQELKGSKEQRIGRDPNGKVPDVVTDTVNDVIIDIVGNNVVIFFSYKGSFYNLRNDDPEYATAVLTTEDYMKTYSQIFESDPQFMQEVAAQGQTAALGKILE